MTAPVKYPNPARGAAGRAQMLKNAAARRAEKAQAELESQGYLVVGPEHADQIRRALADLDQAHVNAYARHPRAV